MNNIPEERKLAKLRAVHECSEGAVIVGPKSGAKGSVYVVKEYPANMYHLYKYRYCHATQEWEYVIIVRKVTITSLLKMLVSE